MTDKSNDSPKQETRLFNPPAELAQHAAISGMEAYRALCAEAERDYEGFWGKLARENLAWHKPFTQVLDESQAPFYKWFVDGELNVSYNCLDRNLANGNADKTAIIFEADGGKVSIEQIASKQRGIVGTSSCDEDYEVDLTLANKIADAGYFIAFSSYCALKHLGLFGDLLEH